MRKWTTAAVLAGALAWAPAAFAASSPAVSPGAVTAIGQTGVTLHATVTPNGAATTYQFNYGSSNTLGKFSPAAPASAGAGTTAVSESTKLTGLSPDTTYYYAVQATNSYGSTSSPVETFKTTGNPAPTITIEPATGVGRYVVTMVDTISPNNQATSYHFEYGLTDTYGFQTYSKTLPAGTTPVFVTQQMAGIAPGTVFHYRLVASHGSTSTTYGPDQTFETYPWPRPRVASGLTVSLRHASKAPFFFTVGGKYSRPTLMPPTVGCSGTVKISYRSGSRELTSQQVTVAPDCSYSASIRIGSLPSSILRANHTARITVRVRFGGAPYQAPATALKTVTVG